MGCFPAELVMSLTGLSAYQGPANRFSPVGRTGRYSADHPADQPRVGVGHLSGCPLFHPPEGGAIASQAEGGATSSPFPGQTEVGPVPTAPGQPSTDHDERFGATFTSAWRDGRSGIRTCLRASVGSTCRRTDARFTEQNIPER